MLKITDAASAAARKTNVEPNLVFSIEGYSPIYGAEDVYRVIKIGDPGLTIGGGWKIGGLTLQEDAKPYVSFTTGGQTTSKLTQQISPDRSQSTSVTSLVVSVLDKGEVISELISPGFVLADILGVNATVKLGFTDTAYPDDYVTIFRGIIQSVDSAPGMVHFTLASTEAKKNVATFAARTWPLKTAFLEADVINKIFVSNPSLFAQAVNGPDGEPDDSIAYYVKIDSEFFGYADSGVDYLANVTRSRFNSPPADHDVDADVQSVYGLTGNGIDLALKIMLSGWNGPFVEDIAVTEFNKDGLTDTLWFRSQDLEDLYGLTPGDYCTITGATTGGNDQTLRISTIEKVSGGTYLSFEDASFVAELGGSAVCAFRSQYDTLGQGLKLMPNEVDVAEHQRLQGVFLSAFEFDFILEEIPNTKSWIEQELYLPMACFSVPRKGRSSICLTVGPIVYNNLITLDTSNVKNASTLRISRSLSANFANTVRYKYDYDVVLKEFTVQKKYESDASLARINIGETAIEIEASGVKTANAGEAIAEKTAERLLGRYQFGAEYIKGIKCHFGDGFALEMGDIVIVDFASLKLTDVSTGNRNGTLKLFEVINKSLDVRTGDVSVDIVSTNFQLGLRYGTISPSSLIAAGATTTRLPLQKSFGTKTFQKESTKWADYIGLDILIHNDDWTYQEAATLLSIDKTVDPEVMVVTALPTPPGLGYTIQSPAYPDNADPTDQETWKARHVYLDPTVAVVSGLTQTKFEVDPSDTDKFRVGCVIRVHNEDWTDDSGDIVVSAVNIDDTIETATATGFTIDTSHQVELIGFKDGGQPYRWL